MALSDYDPLFESAGQQYNVDPRLLKAVAYTESRGDPDVVAGRRVSSTGAQGLMQFMPATAKSYGIDPQSGRAHIPIERAMRMLVERSSQSGAKPK